MAVNNEAKIRSAARAVFDDYLHSHSLKRTPERMAILDAVTDMNRHFTIENLHDRIVDGGYRLSLGTVYNTIRLLVDCGLMRCHRFGGQAEYERVSPVGGCHLHLVCIRCGSVRELREADLLKTLSDHRYSTFKPDYFDLTVYGTCSRCQRRRRASNDKKQNQSNSSDKHES